MKTRTKVPIKNAVHRADETAGINKLHNKSYRKATSMSKENIQEQIGLLLWFLCSPISEKQSVAGWQLLEVMLSARYERGKI